MNEPELRSDFEEFCHKMRTKWHFRNEPTLAHACCHPNLPGNHLWVTLMLRCS